MPLDSGTWGQSNAGQPPAASPTGFGGLAQGLGLASNYNAKAYGGLDSGKGFGPGSVAGSNQWGNQAQGALASGNTYQQGALNSLNDPRIAQSYGLASQQVSAPQYNGGYANLLFRQGVDDSIAAQNAMAHSANPNQSGLAAYNAANKSAQIQQNAVGQGAMADLQMKQQYDALQAQTDLANRQENLGLLGASQQNAQFGAGINAQLAGQQYGLQGTLAGQQLQQAGLNEQGQEAYQQLASQNYNAAQGINAGVAAGAAQAGNGLFDAALGAASGGMGYGAMLAAKSGSSSGASGGGQYNPQAGYNLGF